LFFLLYSHILQKHSFNFSKNDQSQNECYTCSFKQAPNAVDFGSIFVISKLLLWRIAPEFQC